MSITIVECPFKKEYNHCGMFI